MNHRILYLHGFASGPQSGKAQFFRRKFAERGVALEIPDLAGGDFANLTLSGQLRVIEREAAGEPVSLIGSSMGGYLAALYAARHAEVQKVVLMAPAFEFIRRWPERFGEARMAEWKRAGSLSVFHYGERAERELNYRIIEDGAQYEDYPEVKQPVLIFHGRGDETVPCVYSEKFAAARPNVRLHLLDSGHELLDQLDFMWERTCEFLTR